MEPLINLILSYESDTFNAVALGVTAQEAEMIARSLFMDLCNVVEQGGHIWCDGLLLASRLEDFREEDEPRDFVVEAHERIAQKNDGELPDHLA
jgi:hypothetical protein